MKEFCFSEVIEDPSAGLKGYVSIIFWWTKGSKPFSILSSTSIFQRSRSPRTRKWESTEPSTPDTGGHRWQILNKCVRDHIQYRSKKSANALTCIPEQNLRCGKEQLVGHDPVYLPNLSLQEWVLWLKYRQLLLKDHIPTGTWALQPRNKKANIR